MSPPEVYTINRTATSQEVVRYLLRERSESNLPCTRNVGYELARSYLFDSVSRWSQVEIADKQLEQRFNKLAKKWKRETINISSIQQIVLHPAYQEIIAIGGKVVPLILKQLKRKPDFWFWALRVLTRANPITKEMRGNVIAMRKAWLDWGSEHAYL
jgi:hypothetical protein